MGLIGAIISRVGTEGSSAGAITQPSDESDETRPQRSLRYVGSYLLDVWIVVPCLGIAGLSHAFGWDTAARLSMAMAFGALGWPLGQAARRTLRKPRPTQSDHSVMGELPADQP